MAISTKESKLIDDLNDIRQLQTTKILEDLNSTFENNTTSKFLRYRTIVVRTLVLLNGIRKRLEIALLIPHILQNREHLSKFLPISCHETLVDYCSAYLDEGKKLKKGFVKLDHNLVKAIDLVNSYCMDKDCTLIRKYLLKVCPFSFRFLSIFGEFELISEIRLSTVSEIELGKEIHLHKIWHENAKLNEKIRLMEKQLHDKVIKIQWQATEKTALIKKHKMDFANKKWHNNILIQQINDKTNEDMIAIYRESERRQAILKENALRAQEEYETLLKRNTKESKDLEAKKAQALTQLKGWIKKYDTNIGERKKELDELNEELRAQNKVLKEFMVGYNELEKSYYAILAMKDALEKRAQKEKLLLFMMNRAAKYIQRTWKAYLQRKKKKSKLKAKKKK